MSIGDLKKKASAADWYKVLFVPAFIMLVILILKPFTPVFDPVTGEYAGLIRAFAVFAGVCGVWSKKDKVPITAKAVLFMAAGIGLIVLLETGITFILDGIILMALVMAAGLEITAFSLFAASACTLGATAICAVKGYIRDYSFNGINALGFRTPVGLTITAGLVIVSVITVVYMQVKDRDIKRGAAGLIYTSVFAGVVTILILKSLNLAAAVEPGQYQIFGGSSSFGIEARMKGFEDYKIGFGNAAPTDFTITPDGDHYLITMDSYGITKTLCILEGNLMAGNYEQSEPAHLWDIEAVSGTPYFTIVNVETGYAVAMDDDGMLELIAGGADDDRCLMRIGAENIEYYERLASQDEDMSAAVITLDDEVPYSGNAVYPSNVTVELNGQMLEEGIDYELYFWDNYIPGTAHVTVTGIGDHSGSTGADYEIIYNDFELDDPFNRNTSDYIIRMYRMAFMRLPSIEEVKSWSVALTADNRTPDSVVWEAYWSGGLCHSNASFVEAVYRLMLLRNGSRAELRNWINELDNGATREAVIGEISASPDYQNIWHNFGIGFR